MEDPEVKKKLRKVPDVDKDGEPIWKIERGGGKAAEKKRSNVLPFTGKGRERKKP
jgi:hypothetical protein